MARRVGLLLVGALLGAAVGCSHEVTSPKLTSQAVSPDLVCVEQLTTSVALTGNGFTPMPIDTLKGERHLVLPSVRLARVADLAGAAASGEMLVPDDPLDPGASLVQWQSEQQMSPSTSSGGRSTTRRPERARARLAATCGWGTVSCFSGANDGTRPAQQGRGRVTCRRSRATPSTRR